MIAAVVAAAAAFFATAQPRLGVVDATPTGAPDIAAAVAEEAKKLGKLDVQPADAIDAAVAEARKVGAACGIDDPPECWARFGVLSELDRIVVLRVTVETPSDAAAPPDAAIDLLYVDVPTRTSTRSSTQLPPEVEKRAAAAAAALSALLTGKPSPNPRKTKGASSSPSPKPHGALWNTGVYTAAFGGIIVVGCGGGALAVSSQLASKLVAARDEDVPLDDSYRALDAGFVGLGICAAVAGVAGVAGAVVAGVAE